jgi:predicted nucleotidyltransferase
MNKIIVEEIKQKLKKRLLSKISDKVVKVIIFGSYAKGDETQDSDLDILIVVTDKSKKLEKQIFDITYEIMWEYDFTPLISLEIMTEEHWRMLKDKNSSFYRNIQREGIIL